MGDNIEQPVVLPIREALRLAQEQELDLIEISPKAEPPVCRIADYQKFLYQQKKKAKELKANQVKVVVKEIRFGPQTDDHDYNFKLKHAMNFLKEGSKVKAYVFLPSSLGIISTLATSSRSVAKRSSRISPCSLKTIERPRKKT